MAKNIEQEFLNNLDAANYKHMERLTSSLNAEFETLDRLEGEIKKNLAGLGYGF